MARVLSAIVVIPLRAGPNPRLTPCSFPDKAQEKGGEHSKRIRRTLYHSLEFARARSRRHCIDVITVTSQLEAMRKDVGGRDYVSQLDAYVPTATTVTSYAPSDFTGTRIRSLGSRFFGSVPDSSRLIDTPNRGALMQRLFGIVFVLLILASSEVHAAKLIAVLPLDVRMTSGKLTAEAQASLEEMLRDAATNALAPAGWTVLTGETTIQVLRDNGVNPEECGNQSCHLEMAREIKAEKFLSGTVQYVEGQFIASIRLIDTGTGRILTSERATGKTVTKLREAFEDRASAFFVHGGLRGEATPREETTAPVVETDRPQVRKGKVTEAVGSFTVTAKPLGLVRLELVDPKGRKFASGSPYKNEAALPGRWKVIAKASGYSDEEQTVEVPPDDITLVKFELRLLGGLSITGEPQGAAVEVTGPHAFKDEGGLPWEATGLRRGTYQVKVTRTGYVDATEQVDVESGKTAKLKVVLQRATPSEKASTPAAMRRHFADLFIETEPPGASVSVNGWSPANLTTPLTVPENPVGETLVVKLFLKGRAPKEVHYIMTGKNDHLIVNLDAVDDAIPEDHSPSSHDVIAEGKATLKISCYPQSKVYVDGRKVGSASATSLHFETTPGTHRVACETETGAKTAKEITVSPGESKTIGIRVTQ